MKNLFTETKYTRWYYDIINDASGKNRNKKYDYYEDHHIIPKSLGGSDKRHNRVLLTAREHFICHLLLPKMSILPINRGKMAYAFFRFKDKTANSKLYESYKKEYSLLVSGENNPFYGKTHTKDTKKKISRLGTKHSPDTLKKMSNNAVRKFGSDNPAFGVSKTYEQKRKQSESLLGRIGVSKNGIHKRVHKELVQGYIDNGWTKTKKDRRKKYFKVELDNGVVKMYNKLSVLAIDMNMEYNFLRHRYYVGKYPIGSIISIERVDNV